MASYWSGRRQSLSQLVGDRISDETVRILIGQPFERWAGLIGPSVHSFARGGASSTGGVMRLQKRVLRQPAERRRASKC